MYHLDQQPLDSEKSIKFSIQWLRLKEKIDYKGNQVWAVCPLLT